MNMNDGGFLIDRLKWVGLYKGIGLILVFVLPSPTRLNLYFWSFVLINFLRVRSFMKRYGGISRIRDVLGSLLSSTSGNDQTAEKSTERLYVLIADLNRKVWNRVSYSSSDYSSAYKSSRYRHGVTTLFPQYEEEDEGDLTTIIMVRSHVMPF
jgi:hypothetical protein